MIKLQRGPAPAQFLSDRLKRAKDELESLYKNTNRMERFRFNMNVLAPVREDLLKLSHGKCVYCESKLGVVTSGEIENFRPKGGARGLEPKEYAPMHYWWLAYDWSNLFMSCEICNSKYKRDYFPLENESMRSKIGATGNELINEQALLIDPFLEDPGEHIIFGSDGLAKALTKKGKVTIDIIGLNRKELVHDRKIAAEMMLAKLSILQRKSTLRNTIRQVLDYVQEIHTDNASMEYVAVQRDVFNNWYELNRTLWDKFKFKINHNVESQRQKPVSATKNRSESASIKKVTAELKAIKRFSIKSVEIENFKSIEHLKLEIKSSDEANQRESWLLLLGDNGIGKSSILQAIALALCSRKQLAKLKLEVTDYLRRGKRSGKVTIHSYEHDQPVVLTFTKDGFVSRLNEAPAFLMSYGSTRLLPKGAIKSDKTMEPYQNIKNLFDYSIALHDPNAWLTKVDPKEFKARVGPAFFDVLALRGKDKLWLKKGKINIQQFGEDHELEDNSDGYKTITALVADIMQTLSVDKASYHNSHGIVLIDEIGNHLHPRWRMKIASALRKAFPKLQFIVTTHEPLCLRGLSQGEVVVLVRDEQHSIRALDGQLLPDHNLMSVEQLLTSDLFGLINVTDEETEKTYEEYYRLLSKKENEKSQDDLAKINELSAKLSDKQVLGNTPTQQVLYKVIDQTIAQKIREEGFKTKEELKKETIEEVSNMIKSQKIDWL